MIKDGILAVTVAAILYVIVFGFRIPQSDEQFTVIHVIPGHKLIELNWRHNNQSSQPTLWLQTRPALPDEEPGSLLYSEYDPNTGKSLHKILIVEQPAEDPDQSNTPEKSESGDQQTLDPDQIIKKYQL